MPGNEVGERVHDFFQQGNFSLGQHQTQTVEGNWPGLNNNLWGGKDSQISGAVTSKSCNAQKSGSGGQGNQLTLGPCGLNFAQSNLRPEIGKSQLQNQQLILNAFLHGTQVSHARQSEASGLGIVTEPDWHNLTSRGMPVLEQQRSGPHHSNIGSMSFGNKEFPINFQFLGGQQQMIRQQPGVLQSQVQQQSGISDSQLLQQQVILKQMQELQRQQQMQQLEAMRRNTMNQVPSFLHQAAGNHAPGNHAPCFINGSPMHDASNYPRSSQLMGGSTNWLECGASPAVPAYSNGVAMSPEHGQSLPLMGLIPQQGSQSLYGVPVSNARSGAGFMPNQVDNTGLHKLPIQSSLSGDQTLGFLEQAKLPEGTMVSRQGFEGKSSFEHASSQGSGHTISVEAFNQMQQRSLSALDGRQDVAVSSVSSLPGENVKQVASSQPSVALDPTEEKILFGSDDNIWEAFGGDLTGSNGSYNNSDGAFPSIHSGSWSALMQSAVAEISSSDIGLQGEQTGVGVQKSGSLSRNQQSLALPSSGNQPAGQVDGSPMTFLCSRSFSDASLSSSYHHSGLQQTVTNQPREIWPNRSNQPSPEEGKKLLEHSRPRAISEGSHIHQQAYSSGNFNSKNTSDSWTHQQSTTSLANGSGGLSYLQSVPHDRGTGSSSHGRGTSSSFVPHSDLEMEGKKINSMDDARTSDKHYPEFWRPNSPAIQSAVDGSGNYQQHLSKGIQSVLDSSMNSSERGATDMPVAGNSDKKENSSDSYSSNLSGRASTGGLRQNVWLDASDGHGVLGGKQNPTGQTGQRTRGPRKFQYHPMGDVDMDMEHSYWTKTIMQSQTMPHHIAGVLKSHEGQSRVLSPSIQNSALRDKGDIKVPNGISSSNIHPGYVSSTLASVDKSGDNLIPSNYVTSSQNMLELLNKVDQSKEHNAVAHLSSNDWDRLSGISETEASNGNAGFSPKQSSSAQGFGLQLAPPSQGLRASNVVVTSRSLSQTVCSPSSSYIGSDKGDKVHIWLGSAVSIQSSPPVHEIHQGDPQINKSGPGQIHAESPHSMQANPPASFPSGSLYQRSMLQTQQMAANAGMEGLSGQSAHVSLDGQASHDIQTNTEDAAGNLIHVPYSASDRSTSHVDSAAEKETTHSTSMCQSDTKVSAQQTLALNVASPFRPSITPGLHQKSNLSSMVPNRWTNGATVQQLLAARSFNAANMLKNPIQSSNILGRSSFIQQGEDGQYTQMNGDPDNSQGFLGGDEQSLTRRQSYTTQKTPSTLQGKESSAANLSDASVPDTAASERDIEIFGRSLKPNSSLVDNHSLLHQMRTMKGMDPSKQPVKRFKGLANELVDRQMVGKSSHTSVSSADAMALSEPGNYQEKSNQLQHGAQVVGNTEQQLMIGKSAKDLGPAYAMGQVNAVVDTRQMPNVWQRMPHSVTTPSTASLRPKKRKSAMAELLPWHKEVALGSQRLQNMSSAEVDWAQAAHHLIERIEDEIDVYEDVAPVIRSRRRLVLTMQLMQQIFRPPPAATLSLDATTEHENVMYTVARLALGDACSLIHRSESVSCTSHGDENLHSEVEKVGDRISDQHQKKLVEDFTNKARMLENDLLRLDKRVSVLDLRLECQDLERFSIINCLAQILGRGHTDGTGTLSSSAAAQRICPQRYVNAYPMPKNLPEKVQCHSL